MLVLDLNLTYKCNFRCDYCFENDDYGIDKQNSDLDASQLKDVLKEMLNHKRMKTWNNEMKIVYWGGEPTLKIKEIYDLMHCFRDYKNIHHFLYTNGYIIDDVMKMSKEFDRFKFQISYDGFQIHNKHRRTKDGKKTADIVRSNIIRCIDENLDFQIKAVLPIEDIEYLKDSYEDYADLNEYSIKKRGKSLNPYNPSFPIIREYDGSTWTEEEKEKISRELRKVAVLEKKRIDEGKNKIFSYFVAGQKKTCGCGRDLFMIDYDGNVYICHGAVYSEHKKDHLVSHINKKTLMQDLEQSKRMFIGHNFTVSPEHCKKCEADRCSICNIIQYELSKKSTYIERMKDYGIQPKVCYIYKKAGEIWREMEGK